jgi:hypothetical protein
MGVVGDELRYVAGVVIKEIVGTVGALDAQTAVEEREERWALEVGIGEGADGCRNIGQRYVVIGQDCTRRVDGADVADHLRVIAGAVL